MTIGRSLQASTAGIEKARRALRHHSLTQKVLAEKELKISRKTVDNFFKGQRVDRNYFYKICQRLNLEWEEIVGANKSELEPIDIDALVEEVRSLSRKSIVTQCGTMQVLDMTQPIGLNDIYTSVNILETISGRRRLEIADLLQGCKEIANFNRFGLGRITEERVLGLTAVDKHSKLIVLGKPGAGKTTFLKYLAIKCSSGEFRGDRVPIFIALKDFAEAQPNLLVYMTQLLSSYNVAATETELIREGLPLLLKHGRAMILLDGLDEVKEEDSCRILKQIRDFSQEFHTNQFVMTCRIAALEYTFEQFIEVEVADFNSEQVFTFASKWFAATDPVKGNKFIQKLAENAPIQELATNPLLLTLLCLVFEESADFPWNRSQLYKEGLDLLLKKWDVKKNIERDRVYKKLTLQQKEDLLSQLARVTFEQGNYFFKQKEVELHISNYIRNLPGANTDLEALQMDSCAVLRSIEMQHGLLVERARGIYSFSHLTFQEYFTSREIVDSPDPQSLETALRQLVERVAETRWREVFLLTVSMLRNANYLLLLMKQQVDDIVVGDSQVQVFLTWLSQKSRTVTTPYKPVAIRAFYLALTRILVLVSSKVDLDRALTLSGFTLEIAFTLDPTLTLNATYPSDLNIDRAFTLALARALTLDFIPAFNLDFTIDLNPELERSLQQLKAQVPDSNQNRERLEQWWQANGGAWTEQLRAVMIKHRNIGRDWQFSDQQKAAMKQYHDANRLLVDCLNSDCYVTRAVREEIEETLLLPIAEIEQRKRNTPNQG